MSYYVIHYEDGTGIVVQAEDRGTARSVGETARDDRVSAAVREDEGATITDAEKEEASTKDNPYRFQENILN